MRHPADEKRFTVACPMPRDAPVSNIVRRGAFEPAKFWLMEMEGP